MNSLQQFMIEHTGKECATCSNEEIYQVLLGYVKRELTNKRNQGGKKRLYYISAEFLTGKLLSNNLINLGIYDQVADFLRENGKTLSEIEDALFVISHAICPVRSSPFRVKF